MKAIQGQSDKHISKRSNALLGFIPIVVGAVVFLCTKAAAWILFWLSQNRMPKGGLSAFVIGYFIEGMFQIIPFVVIGHIVRGLIRKEVGKAEIYLKMMFMLIPVTILTAYWLFVYAAPFMRGGLLFINLFLVFIGNVLARVVSKWRLRRRLNSAG